ncbi:MAG: spermidine/putrescine ABC transporter substrate-binding protein [Desulfuromusa sp.]|nr:spermidine/putrescine ABC transporter substrate-binding protein [Desulfuromusa sp.]
MSSRKNNLLIIFLVLIATALISIPVQAANPIQELTFLNWGDYLSPDLQKKFETKFNVKIRLVTYDSDDNRNSLLLSTDGKNFDVALIDGNSIPSYIRSGWLTPISDKDIPNRKHIIPRWRDAYEGAKEYSVPYFWGTVGIAYRSDLVKSPMTSWMDILKPAEELRGKIFMFPQSRELVDIGLKALGYSVNTLNDPKAYKEVKKLLIEQKPYVKQYDCLAIDETSALIKGEILAATNYSGDALTLQAINEDITYIVPSEGSFLWVDYLVVMAKSEKKKLAMDFINFLNNPENAAEHAEYMYYATPNAAAEKLLAKEFLDDPYIYPAKDVMEKCEIEAKLPPRINKTRNLIYSEVTRGKI